MGASSIPNLRQSLQSPGESKDGPVEHEAEREARQIVSRADQLVNTMRAAGQGRSGGLMIGHHSPISAGNLRATLFGWHASNPDIDIDIDIDIDVDGVEAEREDLINGLKDGMVDIAIMIGEASYPGMNRATFWSERLLVAMPAAHALAEREWVQWYNLRNETFLLTASDPGPEPPRYGIGPAVCIWHAPQDQDAWG
ncbi:LysR substrate binding domain-containing protein [Sinorhizobium sp. NFACC03]|nr:LysR substrate binding domain-containing protein [Sinorhizobium sp. NFACC03]